MKINHSFSFFSVFLFRFATATMNSMLWKSFAAVFFSRTIEIHFFIRDYKIQTIPSSNFFDDKMNRCVCRTLGGVVAAIRESNRELCRVITSIAFYVCTAMKKV